MKKNSEVWNLKNNERQTLDKFSRMVRVKRELRRISQKNSSNRKEATMTLYSVLNNGKR